MLSKSLRQKWDLDVSHMLEKQKDKKKMLTTELVNKHLATASYRNLNYLAVKS